MINFDLRQFSRVAMDTMLPRGSGEHKGLFIEFDISVRLYLEHEWLLPKYQALCNEAEEDDGVCDQILEAHEQALVQLVFVRPGNYTRVLLRSSQDREIQKLWRQNVNGLYSETAYHDSCWDEGLTVLNKIEREMKGSVIAKKSNLLLDVNYSDYLKPISSYNLRKFSSNVLRAEHQEDSTKGGLPYWLLS